MPISGGTPKQLTFTDFDHGAPIWSKDNSHLYFSANFHKDEEFEPANESEIYSISVADGKITPLRNDLVPMATPFFPLMGPKLPIWDLMTVTKAIN
ncbi:MAG: hypothetical protein R2819_00795 [Allomuricauda sp.]